MKKIFMTVVIAACLFQTSFAQIITVVPYYVEPTHGKVMVLLGRKASSRGVLSPRARALVRGDFRDGIWSLPQTMSIFAWEDPLAFACDLFNKKTLYSFARAIVDSYPNSPHASRRDPLAGYSCFIPDDSETIFAQGVLEGRRECVDGGAYDALTHKKDFDDAVAGLLKEQWQQTPPLHINRNYYYFLQVPYIAPEFLLAKRGVIQETFPGPVDIVFGDFEPESKLVGDLGADFEDFVWVDGGALVHTLVGAPAIKGVRRNVVTIAYSSHLELDRMMVNLLIEDAGAIDAIKRVIGQ